MAVKVAIVGTSWWADAMYIPALQKHPEAQIVAAMGRNPERTQAFADKHNIPSAYTDYAKMLDEVQPEAVIVSTGNDAHYTLSMGAIERGVHVLCEKPLAMNYAEAKAMYEAAEAAGVITMVPFTYSFMPTARYLKQLIDAGYIGKPYHMNMRYFADYARQGNYMWRFDLALSGGGVIGDLGTHFVYIARWLFGEVRAVTAVTATNVQRDLRPDGSDYARGDDATVMVLEFESGAQGVIHVSAVCHEKTEFGQTHGMEFYGSDGTLKSYTDWETQQVVRGAKAGEAEAELPIPDDIWGNTQRERVADTYRAVFRDNDFMTRGFISAILAGEATRPTFYDGLMVQAIQDAAALSAAEGRRVALSEITGVIQD